MMVERGRMFPVSINTNKGVVKLGLRSTVECNAPVEWRDGAYRPIQGTLTVFENGGLTMNGWHFSVEDYNGSLRGGVWLAQITPSK